VQEVFYDVWLEQKKGNPFLLSSPEKFIQKRAEVHLSRWRKEKKRVLFLPEWMLNLLSLREKGMENEQEVEEKICEEEGKEEIREKVRRALADLTEREREFIQAYLEEDDSIERASKRLQISINTARTLYQRAVQKLRLHPAIQEVSGKGKKEEHPPARQELKTDAEFLQSLTKAERRVWVAWEKLGHSIQQTARRLRISKNTVKALLKRAKNKKKRYPAKGDGNGH